MAWWIQFILERLLSPFGPTSWTAPPPAAASVHHLCCQHRIKKVNYLASGRNSTPCSRHLEEHSLPVKGRGTTARVYKVSIVTSSLYCPKKYGKSYLTMHIGFKKHLVLITYILGFPLIFEFKKWSTLIFAVETPGAAARPVPCCCVGHAARATCQPSQIFF